MKLFFALALAIVTVTFAHGKGQQDNGRGFVRIRVMHADPWAMKALIEGTSISQPELSSILGFAGIPDRDSEMITSIFGGKGRLVVNPTDNSLLFFPTKG
jgi:hypothetical protein